MKIIINIANSNKSVRFINNKLLSKSKQLKLCDTLNKRSIFELIKNNDETISIKTYKNKFISAQPNGTLECNRDKIDIWEKFTLITQEGEETNNENIYLKTYHNTYVCIEKNKLMCYDTIPLKGNQLNIRYIDDKDVVNIKKEYREKINNDIANGFKVTGMAIGAILVGFVKILGSLAEEDEEEEEEVVTVTKTRTYVKCNICGKHLSNPNSAAHLGSLRHRKGLLKIQESKVKQTIIIKNNRNYIEEDISKTVIINNY